MKIKRLNGDTTWVGNDVYIAATFVDGIPTGYGLFFDKKLDTTYMGIFVDGILNGRAVKGFNCDDSCIESCNDSYEYVEFENGEQNGISFNGYGIKFLSNGVNIGYSKYLSNEKLIFSNGVAYNTSVTSKNNLMYDLVGNVVLRYIFPIGEVKINKKIYNIDGTLI